jgi:hypothetical protein
MLKNDSKCSNFCNAEVSLIFGFPVLNKPMLGFNFLFFPFYFGLPYICFVMFSFVILINFMSVVVMCMRLVVMYIRKLIIAVMPGCEWDQDPLQLRGTGDEPVSYR